MIANLNAGHKSALPHVFVIIFFIVAQFKYHVFQRVRKQQQKRKINSQLYQNIHNNYI